MRKVSTGETVPKLPEEESFRMYPIRWAVLFTVLLFNMSHSIMFQTYSTVSTKAASYYDKDIFYIDLLSSLIFYIGIPMGIISAWIYDQFGMRFGLFLGVFLTFIAAILRSFTSIP